MSTDIQDEQLPEGWDLFSMSDVVDEIERTAPDVVAYVEQTGGGCATIFAALRQEGSTDPVLYQHPDEAGFGRYPVLAGPGTFDWHGRDHEGSLADFYVGPDPDLTDSAGQEYMATPQDTPATLATQIVEAVRGFRPTAEGVIVWPGR
jgi:hypothetical protein